MVVVWFFSLLKITINTKKVCVNARIYCCNAIQSEIPSTLTHKEISVLKRAHNILLSSFHWAEKNNMCARLCKNCHRSVLCLARFFIWFSDIEPINRMWIKNLIRNIWHSLNYIELPEILCWNFMVLLVMLRRDGAISIEVCALCAVGGFWLSRIHPTPNVHTANWNCEINWLGWIQIFKLWLWLNLRGVYCVLAWSSNYFREKNLSENNLNSYQIMRKNVRTHAM